MTARWSHTSTIMRSAPVLALVALCVAAVGCIPVPKKTVARYGVEGRLTDSASRAPIGSRHVSIAVDGARFDRKTNRRGEFRVKPRFHRFWTWLGGPMWMSATRVTVEISLDGRVPYRRTFSVSMEPDMLVPPDRDRLKGNYVALGDIELTKP